MSRWKRRGLLILACSAALTAPSPAGGAAAQGRPGTLDPSFGHDGKVFAAAPKAVAHSAFGAAGLEPDGDLVVELHRETPENEGGIREIERRLPDGGLDPSFGQGGRVRVGLGGGLAVRADGSILVGVDSCGKGKGSLLLLDAAGEPATGYGNSGCGPRLGFPTTYMEAAPDGSIFVGGVAEVCPCGFKNFPKSELAVAKLRPDGSLDPSFGKGGIVRPGVDLGVEVLAPEGAAGIAPTADGGVALALEGSLVAFGPDGALDPGFGSGGKAEVGAFSTALAALPDGRLVVAGIVKDQAAEPKAVVVGRFLADGRLDPSFGEGGRFELPRPPGTRVEALRPAPGNGVSMAGETRASERCRGGCHSTLFLARLGEDGQLDPSYGAGGTLELPPVPSEEEPTGIASLSVSGDGVAIVTGGRFSVDAYAIAATAAGSLDGSFATGGLLLERRYAPSSLEPSGIALGNDGRITIAAEGESGETGFGGHLLGLRSGGRQVGGVPPTTVQSEIVPVHGGFAGWFENVERSEIDAVRPDGRPLVHYAHRGTAVLPDGFRIYGIDPGPAGGAIVLGAIGGKAMAVYRLGPTGHPVRGFGRRGLVRVGFGAASGACVATVVGGGAIVVAGFSGPWATAVKILPTGKLDHGFGDDGRARRLLAPGTYGTAIAPFAGGVAIGSTTTGSPNRFAGITRLDADGRVVRGFGRSGSVRPRVEGRLLGLFAHGHRITAVADDEYARHPTGGVELRAFRPDGSPDRGFGRNGRATGAAGQARYFQPRVVAQQPDGRIVVAGAASRGPFLSQVELLRFR